MDIRTVHISGRENSPDVVIFYMTVAEAHPEVTRRSQRREKNLFQAL